MSLPLLNAEYSHPFEHWVRYRTVKQNKNFLAVFLGEPGSGKCLTKDSNVLMSDGSWKKIQDVKIGDRVISFDKNKKVCYANIVNTNEWLCDDIYEIKQSCRDKNTLYSCSGNHIIPITYFHRKEIKNYEARKLSKMKRKICTIKIDYNAKEKDNPFCTIPIKLIKTDRKEIVYGITVDSPTSYFITDNFLVTHNSWASIALGEGTDPNFGIDNVAASAKEMLEFLTSKTHIKKGTTVVLDEAGVNFSSRKWMTKENRYLGELFQTFRWMNISLLMTLPNFSFLDVQMRRLIQFSFDNPSIDEANKICFTRGRYWKQDPFSDKEPSKYLPFIRYPDGKLAKVAKIGFRKASSELLDAYEKKKKSWNLDMLDKTRKVLVDGHDIDMETKENKKKTDKDWEMKYEIDDKLKKIADNIVNNIDEYTIYKGQKKGWNFNTTAIRADYVMSGMDSLRVVRYLSKKEHVQEYLGAKNESAKKGVGV